MADPVVTFLQSRLEAYLTDLRTLVSQDSYSYDRDDVNHVVDWLNSRLQKSGFSTERYPQTSAGDDLLATRESKGQGRVLLLGHSDTVFPHGTTAKRPMTFKDDQILGPGTCDMKAGLLTGIYAVEALDAVGFHDYSAIHFLIVSDEEIDERHSIPVIRSASRSVDAVFTLEAARANGDIVIARKGVRSFTAEAFGHAAHSGVEPEKGRNVIVALAHQIIALDQLNNPQESITVNVGVIEGGRLRNIVPDYARLRFEARAFTQENLNSITESILALFEKETVTGVTFKVSFEQTSPPMPYTPAVMRIESLAIQIAHELGFEVKGASTGGAADAAFAAAEGIPTLDGLGPIGGLDHGPDEYILKSSILPRTALLAKLIIAVCK
jgi:glutamate carboxypeptidase